MFPVHALIDMTAGFIPSILVALAIVAESGGELARLRPETLVAWDRYVAAVEHRRAGRIGDRRHFLVMDAQDPADRRTAMSGALVVDEMHQADSDGREIDVPAGMVHHWRGAVFLPGVTLDQLMTRLETEPPPRSPEVLRSSILARHAGGLTVHLRLQRTKVVTVVYDTRHDVRLERIDARRGASTSVATRIVEIADAGTPTEHARPVGDDRGFLWRLNAYWRYEAVEGGVLAECESISLSRGVPFGLGVITGPIIRSTARESMERTLESLRVMATGSNPS